MTSQVQSTIGPTLKTWNDYEEGCLATFRGGYDDPELLQAFRHGMITVFTLLRSEFPEAKDCQEVSYLRTKLEGVKAIVKEFEESQQ